MADLRWPYGKEHKDKKIEDLPTGYIEYVLENFDRLSPTLQTELENQLALRRGEGVARKRS